MATLPEPISVVVPTVGRSHLLRNCLGSILACDPRPSEVLVIDQSGDRSTRQLVEETFESRVRHIPCDGRGVARATNLGLRAASHHRVLVTHDDCTVAKDWVGVASQVSQADPHGVLTGRVLPPDASSYVPSTKSSTEPEDFTGQVLSGVLFPSNMCLNRTAVADIGGFDERKGFWYAAEDNDFCYRWLRAGGSLRYEPRMLVWHHDWRPPEQLIRTHINYARSQGVFYAKHLYEDRDRNMLSMIRQDLRRGTQELRTDVRGCAYPLVHGPESWCPRWQRPEREYVPYLLIGMIEGWLESRRLATPPDTLLEVPHARRLKPMTKHARMLFAVARPRHVRARPSAVSQPPEPQTRDPLPAKPVSSTPSWLLPPPIERLREQVRTIRRLTSETHRQVIDARHETVGSFAGLGDRVAEVETLAQQQITELSRISARLEELVAASPRTPPPPGHTPSPQPRHRPVTRIGQAVVLAYHSIAQPVTDPFELAVAPAEFEEHLRVLSAFGHILSVSELGQRIANGTLTDTYFALTFDDGYANNLHTAKPILERHGVPATVFIATGFVGGTPFWWDELAEVILQHGKGGERLTLELPGVARRWQLDEPMRQRVYDELWQLLRLSHDDSRREALAALYSQLGHRPLRGEPSLTPEEIPELTKGGEIEVGAHTVTHPVLPRLGDEEVRKEIASSKAWLEGLLERPVRAFSYPFGDYGPREVEIVRQAGFETAFSVLAQAITGGYDRLEIPRLTVGHWDVSELEDAITRLFNSSRATTVPTATPAPGKIDFGNLRRVTPVSREWGLDRGQPVDRGYIERFLGTRAAAIQGHVLEFGDPLYTRMFGGDRVTASEVLDVTGGATATYTCRLERGDEIPTEGFDCVICTQTLQLIYDLHSAVRTLHRILKPGGSLLVTVPGITPIHHGDQYGDAWHWSLTASSISRLCSDVFGPDSVEVEVFGNVLAASAFLYGLADRELTQDELDHVDADYVVTIGVQARK